MRKLAWTALAFSAAIAAANYILPIEWLLNLAVVSVVLGAALFVLLKNEYRIISAVLIFFSLGLLCFHIHNRNTVLEAEKYDGKVCGVTAEVLDYPEIHDDYCRLDVRIESRYLPNLRALLYDNNKVFTDAKPGDTVYLRAKITVADTLYGEQTYNYRAKGIYLKLSSRNDGELRQGFDIIYLPQYVSHWLSGRIAEIFPGDTEVFMRSLMLGDKSDFYDDEHLYVSLSRSGLMHIVAVSGMHISFLVAMLQSIFGRGRRSAFICILLVWFFVFVTGAGPSVIRAAFMHSYFLMAPILRRENDSITSLAVIFALLLCVNPFAIASMSLQLSFGAMCGIVLFSDKIYYQLANKLSSLAERSFVRKVIASVSCSLSVMVFTFPLTAVHFGNVQLLSPLTNLLSLWAVSICFCWGWLSCALSVVPLLGTISATLCSWIARYILLVAELVSSVPFSVMYMQSELEWMWLALVYAVLMLAAMARESKFSAYALSGAFSIITAAALMYGNATYYRNHDSINVLDVGQGQCITVLSREASVIVDCGNINSLDNAGMIAASHLYSRGRSSVDLLILSHLHEDHAAGAVMLMEMLDVKRLIIPKGCDTDDALYSKIVECTRRNGTELVALRTDSSVQLGEINLKLIKSGYDGDENERCIITRINLGDTQLLAMADSSRKMERKLLDKLETDNVDYLVVSHHGSRYSSCDELLESIDGRNAIISVGTNYYGHPSDETLEALESYGYNVYRTDILGDIEIQIGNSYGKKE